jgi:hypothetical protein
VVLVDDVVGDLRHGIRLDAGEEGLVPVQTGDTGRRRCGQCGVAASHRGCALRIGLAVMSECELGHNEP